MELASILRTCSMGMPGSTLEKLCRFNAAAHHLTVR
jgi:hypothetical protein